MSQTEDRLVYMVNQIARAFAHQKPDKAVAATYDHIWHFWDPRMRKLIANHLASGGAGLDGIARAAVAKLGRAGEPSPVTQATDFTSNDDEMASDAG